MNAGPEISVASTKAFTSQLFALLLLTMIVSRKYKVNEKKMISEIKKIDKIISKIFLMEPEIKKIASKFKKQRSHTFPWKRSNVSYST